MTFPLNILVVSGASRSGSYSFKVAEYLEQELRNTENVATDFINVHLLSLPLYCPSSERSDDLNKLVAQLSEKFNQAHAIVLVSPEYNGGIAGSLKNLLDYFRKEYERKPIGVVSVSSGTFGGLNALHQLIAFTSYVGAFLSNTRLTVSEVEKVFQAEDSVPAERFARNAKKFCQDLVWLTQAIQAKKTQA